MTLAKCSVFIATSLDGFIAREDSEIDWLMKANTLYIKISTKDLDNNERVIAEVSRTVYYYFYFLRIKYVQS